MEKGQGKRTDTLQTDNVFAHKEYIERDAAKRIVDDINTRSAGWRDYAKLQMDSIPAADVVPVRHGWWIKCAPHNSDMMTCSECEKYWILDGDQYDFRYCPNCGARMDGDGE